MNDTQFKNFCRWADKHGFTYEEDNDYYLSRFMSPISNSDLQAFYLNVIARQLVV